ncbi:PREDICTED: uncharacterized protein LOC109159520 [Ipomoea nil]|uniref:uncharacterized protein LOC109159520 n=1 Tax=Ipomoea nil TaxID=35883 RepID=UPI000901FC3E|nr:PREDICTED: uncharacterized protein LOC109159520 [Ipomoea nil]
MQTKVSFHFPIDWQYPAGRRLPYYCCVRAGFHSYTPTAPAPALIFCTNPNLTCRKYSPAKFTSSAKWGSNASPDGVEVSCSDGFSEAGGEVVLDDGIELVIEKTGKNQRTIRSKVAVNASLQTVWDVLTDYERLADFIPGLAVSQLLQKEPNFARLFQIGQQNIAFGMKFDAKGILDCYEKDLQILPYGQRRDIDFKMIEGDFQVFEGKWSVEQCNTWGEPRDSSVCQELHTTLFYVVRVEPKLWLPVRILESRICNEIKVNLTCVREEAQRMYHSNRPSV